jgi:hypothetical protein
MNSLGESATFDAEGAGGLASDQRTSAISDSQVRFQVDVIILSSARHEVLVKNCPRC